MGYAHIYCDGKSSVTSRKVSLFIDVTEVALSYESRKESTVMSTIIIYTSKTGYTEQYAQMLSEALNCEAVQSNHLDQVNLKDYDTIVYGGGIRALKINGLKHILPKLNQLEDKRIVLFAVGATEDSETNSNSLLEKNIEGNHVHYPMFYMQGGFDPDRLSLFMRFMLRRVEKNIRKKEINNPETLSAEDKDFLDFFQSPHEHIERENLEKLINFIRNGS